MSKLVRAFFALPVRDEDKPALLDVLARMRRACEGTRLRPRFIVLEQLHVTVKFLGFVEPEKINAIKAIGARHAKGFDAFDLAWQGVIAFGGPRRARALVAAIAHETSKLAELATAIESDVEPLGVERETRAYHPHVTLVRMKPPGDARSLLEAAALEPAPIRFSELRLYQSEQTPNGGVYSVLKSWEL